MTRTDPAPALRAEVHRLRRQVDRDPLAGIGNRARLLHAVVDGLLVSDEGLGLVFADVDGLKALNDRCGHSSGDMALVQLARALMAVSRPQDLPVRWGAMSSSSSAGAWPPAGRWSGSPSASAPRSPPPSTARPCG